MLREFGPTIVAVLAMALFHGRAQAESDCPEFCDRTNGFSVVVPSGWESIPDEWKASPAGPTPDVTLHMISRSAPITGANCPVLSTLASKIGSWARTKPTIEGLELDPQFWRGALRRAGFTLVGTIKRMPPSGRTSKYLLSYVEFTFKTPRTSRAGQGTLTARQALFWMPVAEHRSGPLPDDLEHIPGRFHFVNCTVKTEALESVGAPFDGVFQSFRPKYCYTVKSSSVPVCVPAEASVRYKDWTVSANEPAAHSAPLSAREQMNEALLNTAVQVLTAGSGDNVRRR